MTHPTSTSARPGVVAHPLSGWVYRVEAAAPRRARGMAAIVLLGGMGLLTAAAWVTPDGSGHGTHRQLNQPPCLAITLLGYPCPTCGMTTAFAHTVRGELGSAFLAQPAGLLLALATVTAVVLSLTVLATGRVWAVNWYRVSPLGVTIAVLAVVVAGWAFKVTLGLLSGRLPVGA